MVLVTLLTGADAARETAETLTVEEGAVPKDEDKDENGFDTDGGPEPAAAVGGLDVEELELRQLLKAHWLGWICLGRELKVGRRSRLC